MSAYRSGAHESLKMVCHGMMIPPLALGAVHNHQMCHSDTATWWHQVNRVLYATVLAWEIVQVWRHVTAWREL